MNDQIKNNGDLSYLSKPSPLSKPDTENNGDGVIYPNQPQSQVAKPGFLLENRNIDRFIVPKE